jgi:hypothetical protein
LYDVFSFVFEPVGFSWRLGLGSKPRAGPQLLLALQNISPGYQQDPRVMKHFGVLDFDTLILILIFEWSMSRSDVFVPP